MADRRVTVELPPVAGARYDVEIGSGCLADLARDLAAARRAPVVAVVSDGAVADGPGKLVRDAFAAAGSDVLDLRTSPGEAAKTRATVERLQDQAIASGLGRDGLVVAVGGGVAGDIAGFVAATLFRGVDFAQVPTTLLAMVDSSVGGKTGVDTPAGKNLVGAFHQPAAVLVDVDTLATLPDRHLSAGLAEVIKYGVILDEPLFTDLEDGLLESCRTRVPEALVHVVERCVTLKAEVVADDEREAGRRQILNFGHTLGHALESHSGFELLHGEAVAIGMVGEARLAAMKVGAPEDLADRLADLCVRAGLPVEIPPGAGPDRVLAWAQRDKKTRAGRIRCALPVEIGRMAPGDGAWSIEVAAREFRELWAGR